MSRYSQFSESERIFGFVAGEQCQVLRVGSSSKSDSPDFTVVDQTPNEIAKYKFYVETTSDKYAMFGANNVEWFTLKGKRGVLQPGDLLAPTGVTPFPSTTPIVTFLSYMPMGIAVGMKTNRVGALYNGPLLVYSNIYFDYLPRSSYPGAPLDREVESSLGTASNQAVMFTRVLDTTIRDSVGMFLYQTDTTPTIKWSITNTTELNAGNGTGIIILDLKADTIQ